MKKKPENIYTHSRAQAQSPTSSGLSPRAVESRQFTGFKQWRRHLVCSAAADAVSTGADRPRGTGASEEPRKAASVGARRRRSLCDRCMRQKTSVWFAAIHGHSCYRGDAEREKG